MPTPARINTNGRIARLTSRPRGATGMAARDSAPHGAFAHLPLAPGEGPADWDRHRDGVVASLAPVGAVERNLAERAASLLWRLARLTRFEAATTAAAVADAGLLPPDADPFLAYRDWRLPAAFGELRRALEGRLGSCIGTRHYIRVLQLLANHAVERVETVVAGCLSRGELDAAAITAAARRLPRDDAAGTSDDALSPDLAAVAVRPADLARFDRLLPHSPEDGDADVRRDDLAAPEGQPQAAQVADHALRVGEVGP